MTVYIDENCKCHVSDPDGLYTQVELPGMLQGKCEAYIEGFRVRPEGHSYEREDGVVFGPNGMEVSPWRDLSLLNEFQAQYEGQQAAASDMAAALEVLGVSA